MILQQLLVNTLRTLGEGEEAISSFEISLTEQDLVFLPSSTSESYQGCVITVLYLSDAGDIVGEVVNCLLNQYTFLHVNAEAFKIRIDVPFWFTDFTLKIWKGLPDMPFSSTSPNISNYPKAATIPASTNTAASATAVALCVARPGRSKLTLYNDSNGTLFIRYAATGTGTSATAANGGWDERIAPYTIFEYPDPGLPPETAINGIWTVAGGGTLVGSCTITEGVNS